MDKIAVLIPCYNEASTIKKVIRDYKQALPEAVIYVYDNNSDDGTDEIAKAEQVIVRYEYQQGKGNDTYPAEAARNMIDQVLQKHADMVVGDRLSATYFSENSRPFHNFGNSLVRSSINFLFQSDIQDMMTGYRAFSF